MSKTTKNILFTILCAAFIAGCLTLAIKATAPTVQTTEETVATTTVATIDPEVQKIMEEEDFRKSTELRATKILIERKKKEATMRYNLDIKEFEKQLEGVRAKEMQLIEMPTSL